MSTLDPVRRERLLYAFGHLVASFNVEDAHHADSGDLAEEVLVEAGFSEAERGIVAALAEDVAGDYEYTGEATEVTRRIEAGEL